jgi:hypothetical protein
VRTLLLLPPGAGEAAARDGDAAAHAAQAEDWGGDAGRSAEALAAVALSREQLQADLRTVLREKSCLHIAPAAVWSVLTGEGRQPAADQAAARGKPAAAALLRKLDQQRGRLVSMHAQYQQRLEREEGALNDESALVEAAAGKVDAAAAALSAEQALSSVEAAALAAEGASAEAEAVARREKVEACNAAVRAEEEAAAAREGGRAARAAARGERAARRAGLTAELRARSKVGW